MLMDMIEKGTEAMIALTAIARLEALLARQGVLPAGALAAELLQASGQAAQDVQFATNAGLQRALATGLATYAARLSQA